MAGRMSFPAEWCLGRHGFTQKDNETDPAVHKKLTAKPRNYRN
jgi:hypothetical protein